MAENLRRTNEPENVLTFATSSRNFCAATPENSRRAHGVYDVRECAASFFRLPSGTVQWSGFRSCEELSRRKNAGEAYPVWVRQTGRQVQNFRATKLNPKK
jgi:hypothetical protein